MVHPRYLAILAIGASAASAAAAAAQTTLDAAATAADAASVADVVVTAVVTVADSPGGATNGACLVAMMEPDGVTPVAKETEFILEATADQWGGAFNNNVSLVNITKGTLVATLSGGQYLCRTAADGQFACDIQNAVDEAVWFATRPAKRVTALQYRADVLGCVPDQATWSA